MPLAIASEDDLEQALEEVRSCAADTSAGLFGPDSVMWQVAREQAIFLGAGRALLLQLAHPWVARGIREHSRTLADPIDRFHRTFNVMFTMVFGTVEQALDVARRLHLRHARVTGQLPDAAGRFGASSRYSANEVSALSFVHATLVDTTMASYALVLPPLRHRQRERYDRECKRFARLFGIPEDRLPEDWSAFAAQNEAVWESDMLAIGEDARLVAATLLDGGAGPCAPGWYRALTARLLPPRLREGYGLPYGEREQRQADRALSWIRHAYPFLPERLRCVGPYLEAKARLAGKAAPDVFTRIANRVWIGAPAMGGSDLRGHGEMV